MTTPHLDYQPGKHAICEMDSHADTSVLGENFRVYAHTDHVCDVPGYSPSIEVRKDVPIVSGVTALAQSGHW